MYFSNTLNDTDNKEMSFCDKMRFIHSKIILYFSDILFGIVTMRRNKTIQFMSIQEISV